MPSFGFIGPSYTSESLDADCQETINWYNEIIESGDGNSQMVLYPSPGEKVFASLTVAPVNGLFLFDQSVTGSTGAGVVNTTVSTPSATPATSNEWAFSVSGASTNTPAVQVTSASAPWTHPSLTTTANYWQQVVTGPIAFAGTVPLASFWASAMVLFRLIGASPPTVVQSTIVISGGLVAGSYPGTFASPVGSGNTIMVVVRGDLSFPAAGVSVSDPTNGTYTTWADVQSGGVVGGGLAGNGFSYIHIAGVQVVPAGNPTITTVLSQNVSGEIQMIELQGGHP
jgi:hypothetical protein